MKTTPVVEEDKDILAHIKSAVGRMQSHWAPIHAEMREDWQIYRLDQWTDDAKRRRAKRPMMTCDVVRKFVKSVVSETYRTPPGVRLSARGAGSSPKAQAIGDAVRFFEDKSGAIYAYTHAIECAATAGIGWLQVSYRYDDQQDLPAMITVDKVLDPLSVMIDEESVSLDGSDSRYQVVFNRGKESYTFWDKPDDGPVSWYAVEGGAIKDRGEWPATDLPFVPVYGEFSCIDGEVELFGLVRQLRDTQRAWNLSLSEGMERMALTPKSPVIAAQGSIPSQFEDDWVRSCVDPVGILWYTPDPYGTGATLPPPSRSNTAPDIAWLPPLMQMLMGNARETTGIFDSSLGNVGPETSGVAIKARQDSGDRGQLVYSEHLQIAVKMVGRIMLSLLEPVIAPGGILPVMLEDGTSAAVQIGTPGLADLGVTDMDISISSAPAYATRKAEGLDQLVKLVGSSPEMASATMDLIVEGMEFPGGDIVASRLRKLLPPALQDTQEGAPSPESIASMQQQLAELQAQNQQLTSQNQQLQMQITRDTNALLAKAEIDAQAKVAVAQINQENANARTQAQIAADAAAQAQKIHAEALGTLAQASAQGAYIP